MKKIEFENIKIYIRTKNKIYIFIKDEILLYEGEEHLEVLENLKIDYQLEEKMVEWSVILNFSYFYINIDNENDKNRFFDTLKKYFYYKKEKFYFDFIENKYINIFLERKKILEIKNIFRAHKWKVKKIKIDFDCIYNYFKNENIEILQIGDEESLRFIIEDRKIIEMEKLELKIDDLGNISEFDFGNMNVVELKENDINTVFQGENLYDNPDFMRKKEINFNLKSIKVKDIFFMVLLILLYFIINSFIPLEKGKIRNDEIRKEIKLKENEYLKRKNEKLRDYSKELEIIEDINESMNRKEYYSLIKFLIDNSIYGIDYTKIEYENKEWIIQGEISDFNLFEKFENNIEKKYKKTELGYIKDEDEFSVFEYKILEK